MLHEVEGDPGGATKFGISQRAHPDVDVPNLEAWEAMDIARTDYWAPVHAEHLHPDLRWHVFDTAFNAGVKQAGILLQRSVNLCRQAKGQTTFLKEDGIVGTRTLHAVGLLDGAKLARVFRAYRAEHYLTLAEIRSPQFIHGWLRRAEGDYNG